MIPFDERTSEALSATNAINFSLVGAINLLIITDAQAPDPSSDSVLADVSANEVTTGSGYPAGGLPLSGVTYGKVGSSFVLSADNLTISQDAVGGFSNARFAVAYQVSSGKLLAFEDLTTNRSNTEKALAIKFTGNELLKWQRG